jgi:hypothetical protein
VEEPDDSKPGENVDGSKTKDFEKSDDDAYGWEDALKDSARLLAIDLGDKNECV